MRSLTRKALFALDTAVAATLHPVFRQRLGKFRIVSFLFHALLTREEMHAGKVDPQQETTPEYFRSFLLSLRSYGFRFLSLEELELPGELHGDYALITFDDGYFNNVRSLPIIEELQVPISIFLTAQNVTQSRRFWWDVVFTEMKRRGSSLEQIRRRQESMKRLSRRTVDEQLVAEFGTEVFTPCSDADRPLTASEVRQLANHPLVTFGNHTNAHEILPARSTSQITRELESAQQILHELIGRRLKTFAYPSGAATAEVAECVQNCGLQFAFTTQRGIIDDTALRARYFLRRNLVDGRDSIQSQILRAWSPLGLAAALQPRRTYAAQ